jgi:hypothetical protein
MLLWFYVALHLLFEAGTARRDARIRFLKAQVEIPAVSWAATGSFPVRTTALREGRRPRPTG